MTTKYEPEHAYKRDYCYKGLLGYFSFAKNLGLKSLEEFPLPKSVTAQNLSFLGALAAYFG